MFATYLTFALTGCAQAVPLLAQPPVNPVNPVNMALGDALAGTVTATAKLSVKLAPTKKSAKRKVLGTGPLLPWKKSDIHHVKVTLKQGSTTIVTVTVNAADLNKRVTFGNLRRNTTYEVELRAWADAGETQQIDNIDVSLASCSKEFTTTDTAAIDIGSLPLRLRDRAVGIHSNQAGIAVTDGGATDAAASETITVAAFDPDLCAPDCAE